MRYLRHLTALGALIVTGGLGIIGLLIGTGALDAAGTGTFLATAAGTVVVLVVGVALLLTAMHYVVILADRRVNAVTYVREAELGKIEVTPHAVKELIAGILREEVGIERFRVVLHHAGQGVAITVRTTLAPDQRVTELGERIQRQLTHQVAERTGVEVRSVSVQVRSIRRSVASLHNAGGKEDAE